jgi:hypothetical protein
MRFYLGGFGVKRQVQDEIDRVVDPGVHPLAAGRAVDVSRVADEEGAAFAEMLRYPVMDVIGRKPVHFPDIDFAVLNRPIADIFEFKSIGAVRALVAHGSNQPASSLSASPRIQPGCDIGRLLRACGAPKQVAKYRLG